MTPTQLELHVLHAISRAPLHPRGATAIAWALCRETGESIDTRMVNAALQRLRRRGLVTRYQGAGHVANPTQEELWRVRAAA
jgi:repressor of nif and glnA expression